MKSTIAAWITLGATGGDEVVDAAALSGEVSRHDATVGGDGPPAGETGRFHPVHGPGDGRRIDAHRAGELGHPLPVAGDEEIDDVELHRVERTGAAVRRDEPGADDAVDRSPPQQLPGAPEAADRTGLVGRRTPGATASHDGHACHRGIVANDQGQG